MGRFFRRNGLHALVSQRAHVCPLEKSFSPAEQDRRDRHVQFIDEPGTKILPDRVRPAANAHIHVPGCIARPFKRLVNATGDEVKCGPTFHIEWRACVMREDERWNVIRRVVPPPALPVQVGPCSANWSEHVSSENPGSHVPEAARCEVVIDPGCATVDAKQCPLDRARREQPRVQFSPADAKRIGDILIRTRPVPIKRNTEAFDPDSCHFRVSLRCSHCGPCAAQLVWCSVITLNYFRVFCPECCVARRRHSPAMTPSRALPRDKIHRNFVQLDCGTPH